MQATYPLTQTMKDFCFMVFKMLCIAKIVVLFVVEREVYAFKIGLDQDTM